jgi:hypothetical protein
MDRPAASRVTAAAVTEEAVYEFTDRTRARFVVRLTDPGKTAHARRVLSGGETGEVHTMGKIVKQPADHNFGWSFYLTPDSVRFFDAMFDICDASIPYVEDHLDEVGGPFLPGLTWCPWDSRLPRELTRSSSAAVPADYRGYRFSHISLRYRMGGNDYPQEDLRPNQLLRTVHRRLPCPWRAGISGLHTLVGEYLEATTDHKMRIKLGYPQIFRCATTRFP